MGRANNDICRRYQCTILTIYSDPLDVVCVAVMLSDEGEGWPRGRGWGVRGIV